MKRNDVKSHCPINYGLEIFGDPWSLLIVRDIASYGKHTYGEFLQSKEGISTQMLTLRLSSLKRAGIISSIADAKDKRKLFYHLTPKGEALLPALVELATWGATFDPNTNAPQIWKNAVAKDVSQPEPTQTARLPFFRNGRMPDDVVLEANK